MIGISMFASWFAPYDPTAYSVMDRLGLPSRTHLLGTDEIGRDILSRIIYGVRTTLLVSLSSAFLAGIIGVPLGLLASYKGGMVEAVIMRCADIQLSLPSLVMVMILIVVLEPGIATIILALGLNGWMAYARLTYAESLRIRDETYIEACRSMGFGTGRILFRHFLPNLYSQIVTLSLLEVALFAQGEAALSFLGFGVQPPTVSLGLMMSAGRDYMLISPWIPTVPGLALALLVLSFNLLSIKLMDIYEPLS